MKQDNNISLIIWFVWYFVDCLTPGRGTQKGGRWPADSVGKQKSWARVGAPPTESCQGLPEAQRSNGKGGRPGKGQISQWLVHRCLTPLSCFCVVLY